MTTGLGALTREEVEVALQSGAELAQSMHSAGHIAGAALFLEDRYEALGEANLALSSKSSRPGAHT